jgi:uncharacterized protein (TIGR03084 family)
LEVYDRPDGGRSATTEDMTVSGVRQDLIEEQESLDAVVASLSAEQWARETSSPRWSVGDQIGHLTYFDGTAALAITDPEAFGAHRRELLRSISDDGATDDATLSSSRAMSPPDLLAAWRRNRQTLAAAASKLTEGARVEWYGPSMSAKSFLTARLMETWAHGQDVIDAVGATRAPTDRLRHIAQLGVITRRWSYANRGLPVPEGEVRVELTGPSGDMWIWEPERAAGSIAGPAADFCLVVTQRRHVDDTALVIRGDAARDWMLNAQAFAGRPTDGPPPGGRVPTP